jgi:hypothetical protein
MNFEKPEMAWKATDPVEEKMLPVSYIKKLRDMIKNEQIDNALTEMDYIIDQFHKEDDVKLFNVSVRWEEAGDISIYAKSYEDAVKMVNDMLDRDDGMQNDHLLIPDKSIYITGTLKVDE